MRGKNLIRGDSGQERRTGRRTGRRTVHAAMVLAVALGAGVASGSTSEARSTSKARKATRSRTATPRTWLSGAAGPQAANGSFGTWRRSPVRIGGTWTDTFEAQTDQWMICDGPWARWNGPLDLAMGAIFADRGETWAAAARGAYTERWTAALRRVAACWGSRDPS